MRFISELNRLQSVEQDKPDSLVSELAKVLRDRQRAGTKQTFSPDKRTFIVTIACQDPKDYGYVLSHWSLSALRRVVIDKGIVPSISAAGISRILNENEVQPHKNQYWLHSTEKTDSPEIYKANEQLI